VVEFALVGGLFFLLLVSTMNGGLFLYGRNAVAHAADIGVAAIAALGNCDNGTNCPGQNADTLAISRMDTAGLTTTPLITVTSIDIWKMTENSNGTFSRDTSDTACTGSCENIYSATGTLQNPTSSNTAPWLPDNRNVGNTPDFAELVINYNYTAFGGNFSFKNILYTTNVFRLEPQV
jgi:Flp pilus assembly protein TadG